MWYFRKWSIKCLRTVNKACRNLLTILHSDIIFLHQCPNLIIRSLWCLVFSSQFTLENLNNVNLMCRVKQNLQVISAITISIESTAACNSKWIKRIKTWKYFNSYCHLSIYAVRYLRNMLLISSKCTLYLLKQQER